MISLTIRYVSGIIVAVVFISQLLILNALIIVLVGLPKNGHTAVTWSVVERKFLSSVWSLFFRADSTVTKGVDPEIGLLTSLC
ncbi:uncharacterized protein Z518_02988 [Rhinocladiella mackenziei CBS 650.93]|uniref:Uncharacterized protein n=1 Tax=Rhinocladiella mackenziei CBS 650.93 TaxID=1442369 RepID=A0A0D2G1A5_9EURO|nr:uncharacterized protein Z518_02988 [Rhinocladiella mackenziei CBS 650.93]KIX08332.1 hypothetical protein Z518_02988 [Rhinocladiella mackenziei CBS 650.93]